MSRTHVLSPAFLERIARLPKPQGPTTLLGFPVMEAPEGVFPEGVLGIAFGKPAERHSLPFTPDDFVILLDGSKEPPK